MTRLRYNGLRVTLNGAVTTSLTVLQLASPLTHSGGVAVPTLASGDYIPLSILDSTGNLSEVVWATGYTSGALAVTVSRGQEGTTAVAHVAGDRMVGSANVADLYSDAALTAVTQASSAATAAASQAQASAQSARDISQIAVPDGLVKALVADPASQTAAALAASLGGQGFEFMEDFSQLADGPLAGRKTTTNPGGGTLTWYDVGNVGAVIDKGTLTIPANTNGTIRAAVDLPAGVDAVGIGFEVSFEGAYTNGNAVACAALMDGPFSQGLPKMASHLVVSPEAWSDDVNTEIGTAVDNANIGGLHDGGNLLTNGTKYRFEVALDKTSERAYVYDQRGNVFTESNAGFNNASRRAYFQVLRPDAPNNTRPRIHKAWLVTRKLDRVISARAAVRATPRKYPFTVASGTRSIGGSVVAISGTEATFPMPSSRLVGIVATGWLNVTTAGDFYLGVAKTSAPTALIGDNQIIVRASQGTGNFQVNLNLLLTPSVLTLAQGRVGDLLSLTLSAISAGGAATFILGGSDRLLGFYEPQPFLS